eukprot:TRINITY_DN13779_c0_g1_i1.p1 TRINITY_DN13779_c0_g1~~TRINITY_DN13779_c0_g1_i1.p1  ORF type:complete len:320 (+),score=42.21 TRINITY_DN13779_c0_g1_i1:84-1043(+)
MTAPERGMPHGPANVSKISGRFRVSSVTSEDCMSTGEKHVKPDELEEDSDSAQSTVDENTPYNNGEPLCLWRCPSSDSECDEEGTDIQDPEESRPGRISDQTVVTEQSALHSTPSQPTKHEVSHLVRLMEREDHWQPSKRECKNGDIPLSPVVVVLAAALTHAATLFSGSALSVASLRIGNVFTSRVPPKLSIANYLSRLHTYFQCDEVCLLLAFIYIDRVLDANPDFVISARNLHRLVLTCVTIAVKFHDDVYYSNEYYAKVGGIPTCELNAQELQLLKLLGWRLVVTAEEYERYSRVLRLRNDTASFCFEKEREEIS